MKPRQEPAPLTDEDRRIWHWHSADFASSAFHSALRYNSAVADRRDAEIMLFLATDGGKGYWPFRLNARLRRAYRAYQGATIDPATGSYVWLSDHDISYFA